MKKNEKITNIKVENYYIFYSLDIMHYDTLEELRDNAEEFLETVTNDSRYVSLGYVGIGIEYIKNYNTDKETKGAVDVINRYIDQSTFGWSNDYKNLGINLLEEQKEVFQNLIDKL